MKPALAHEALDMCFSWIKMSNAHVHMSCPKSHILNCSKTYEVLGTEHPDFIEGSAAAAANAAELFETLEPWLRC